MPKTNSYSKEALEKAVLAVKEGRISKKGAAKKYGVPRATIQFRLSSKFSKTKKGPETILTAVEEDMLVSWLLECAKRGFSQKKLELLKSVQKYLQVNKRVTPFKGQLPGDGWYRAFLRRHPKLTNRVPEAVTAASSAISPEDLKGWFHQIFSYLDEENFADILKDPERLFNGDEIGFLINPATGKLLAEKGVQNVNSIDRGKAKESITVMVTCSAAGNLCPPMVIFPYKKRPPIQVMASMPDEWAVGVSESGWMVAETFYEYVANHLLPYLKKKEVKFPVILFVDGHKSHMSLHLSNLCNEAGIILVALYPNSTKLLRPLDVAVFKGLKSSWRLAVSDWYSRNSDSTLTKEHFAPVLERALSDVKEEWIKQGFKTTGLYPWNPSAFDESLCLGKQTAILENSTITYGTFKRLVGDKLNTEPMLQILERAFSSGTESARAESNSDDRPSVVSATESDSGKVNNQT